MISSPALVKSAGIGDNQPYSSRELAVLMTRPIQPSDEALAELVRNGAAGDERALEAIYHRFKASLFGLACRYMGDAVAAEDVLQEVFLKAFTHLHEVASIDTFTGWLHRIAVNTCLSHIRAHKAERRAAVPMGDVEAMIAAPQQDETSESLKKPLEEAIQKLPHRLKSVFLMHDVQGYKHEEIAGILGCTTGTSKSQLFKARMKLRDRLLKARVVFKEE